MGEDGADFDALLAEQATLQTAIEDLNAWNLQHEVRLQTCICMEFATQSETSEVQRPGICNKR
jgi:hypothetical protein